MLSKLLMLVSRAAASELRHMDAACSAINVHAHASFYRAARVCSSVRGPRGCQRVVATEHYASRGDRNRSTRRRSTKVHVDKMSDTVMRQKEGLRRARIRGDRDRGN